MMHVTDDQGFALAKQQAQKSFTEGGIPIGSSLIDAQGTILGCGHNERVQSADPTAHGEISCLRAVGPRRNYAGCTIFTTLAPCLMCTGAILQFKIPRVVVGEATTFTGGLAQLRAAGVEVIVVDDPECKALMDRFISEQPATWNEDIGE